ncbi:MAG: DUF2271 domain-containing protein [Trueperaceae bacterium]|nr:DUF2271 domain-containing protein [Trueperaceae bacterium]
MEINSKSRYISRRSFIKKTSAALLALSFGGKSLLAQSSTLPENMEMALDFSVIAPGNSRYRNPYVAVWVEDAEGQAVKTLALWFQQGKGQRWLPDLVRWYRDEQKRKSVDGGDLASTVSSPTRLPGSYSLVWDGLNDKGEAVPLGDYYVCVEMAREHGPYYLIRELVSLGNDAFSATLAGGSELGDVNLEYRSRA